MSSSFRYFMNAISKPPEHFEVAADFSFLVVVLLIHGVSSPSPICQDLSSSVARFHDRILLSKRFSIVHAELPRPRFQNVPATEVLHSGTKR